MQLAHQLTRAQFRIFPRHFSALEEHRRVRVAASPEFSTDSTAQQATGPDYPDELTMHC
ncbi:hypothetical protein GCM10027033_06880 [Leucobacter ruminantium]